MQQANAIIYQSKIIIPSSGDVDSLLQDGYGHKIENGYLALDPCEVLYLVEKNRLAVIDEKERQILSFQNILSRELISNMMLWTKYIIYRDLRGRGFVVKHSMRNGVCFSIYERGNYPKKAPSYELYVVAEGISVTLGHLKEVLDEVKNFGRMLKLAVIDRRGEIVYYSLDRIELNILGDENIE